jgi:lipid-A-disaccharide synthase
MSSPQVMILAGEVSGDSHAAEFVEVLRQRRPDVRVSGMGGAAMQQAGVDVFFDSSIIAVVGLIEVIRHWGDIKRAMAIVRERMEQTRPDLLVLVDYPEFNLKMAQHARSLGIRVLFYISPQVWAWREHRVHKIARLVDHMAVIFEFEKKYYEDAGLPVSFVGHPLVDKVHSSAGRDSLRAALGIDADSRVVGLFPGSRRSEISRLLPVLIETAKRMHAREPNLCFLLPVASNLDFDSISAEAEAAGVGIRVTRDNIYDVISCCDAVASCSGTVTLEIALLEVPLCVVYRVSTLSYLILRRLVRIAHIGLVNIVAQRPVARELLQSEATAHNIAAELFEILDDDDYRARIHEGLQQVRQNLGSGGGAQNMAELVLSLLPETAQADAPLER